MSAVAVEYGPQHEPWVPKLFYSTPPKKDIELPDIQAKFCLKNYLLREAMLASKSHQRGFVHHQYPQYQFAWSPNTLRLHEITYQMSINDILELQLALKSFKGK